MPTHGILKNKADVPPAELPHEFTHEDRQQVLANTEFNSHLTEHTKGERIRAKIAERKKLVLEEELQWDEANLVYNEMNKSATMKIDEPKTPYTGGVNPKGEYYQEDELEPLELGGLVDQGDEAVVESLNGGVIVPGEPEESEEPEEPEEAVPELTPEEKHRRFEELRRKHYAGAGNPLHPKVLVSDDEDD